MGRTVSPERALRGRPSACTRRGSALGWVTALCSLEVGHVEPTGPGRPSLPSRGGPPASTPGPGTLAGLRLRSQATPASAKASSPRGPSLTSPLLPASPLLQLAAPLASLYLLGHPQGDMFLVLGWKMFWELLAGEATGVSTPE